VKKERWTMWATTVLAGDIPAILGLMDVTLVTLMRYVVPTFGGSRTVAANSLLQPIHKIPTRGTGLIF
jgi:hypothetical protein